MLRYSPPSGVNSHIPDTRSSLVHSLLDYGKAVLVGIPTYLVRRLQSVLNAAARLIYHLRPHDHITDALATLHWLRVPERVQYKIAVLTYKVLHDSAPRYLAPLVAVADRPTWSACSAVSKYQPLGNTAHQTVYCWQPCLSGCCSSSLERSARGRHLVVITAVFPASTKDSTFSTIVSTSDSLTAYQASL